MRSIRTDVHFVFDLHGGACGFDGCTCLPCHHDDRLSTERADVFSEQWLVCRDRAEAVVRQVLMREERDDPFQQKRLTEAQQALDAYLEVQRQATDLRIPVLNQNRFLYLVGYYNQATR